MVKEKIWTRQLDHISRIYHTIRIKCILKKKMCSIFNKFAEICLVRLIAYIFIICPVLTHG